MVKHSTSTPTFTLFATRSPVCSAPAATGGGASTWETGRNELVQILDEALKIANEVSHTLERCRQDTTSDQTQNTPQEYPGGPDAEAPLD